jgi:hypothetical protein
MVAIFMSHLEPSNTLFIEIGRGSYHKTVSLHVTSTLTSPMYLWAGKGQQQMCMSLRIPVLLTFKLPLRNIFLQMWDTLYVLGYMSPTETSIITLLSGVVLKGEALLQE